MIIPLGTSGGSHAKLTEVKLILVAQKLTGAIGPGEGEGGREGERGRVGKREGERERRKRREGETVKKR